MRSQYRYFLNVLLQLSRNRLKYNSYSHIKVKEGVLLRPILLLLIFLVFATMVTFCSLVPKASAINVTITSQTSIINPNIVEALYKKGAALDNLGNYKGIIEYFDRALAIDPNYKLAAMILFEQFLDKISPLRTTNKLGAILFQLYCQ